MTDNPYLKYLEDSIIYLNIKEWTILFGDHFKQAIYFFEKGQEGRASFFRDCISRSNKLFDDLSASKDTSIDPSEWRLPRKIRTLLNKQFIPLIFHSKLDDFRDGVRNPETHEIFRNFSLSGG